MQSNGISGWLATSGRGLHFIGDFLLPNSELHKSLGLLATLTMSRKKEYRRHLKYAEAVFNSKNLQEAQEVAKTILDPRTGIPNKDTATIADIRYVARQLLRGFAILRSHPYWKSPEYPKIFTRII